MGRAIVISIVALAAWAIALLVNRRSVRRHDGAGDPRQGVLIFVEPVRWLFIIWGFGPFCRGLRRAGWRGQIRLFRWSTVSGALLVVPDVARRRYLLSCAHRLADDIAQLPATSKHTPNHIAAYSSGCYVALEALKRSQMGSVAHAVLLSPTVSPGYPLRRVSRRCARLFLFYSPLDVLNLIGPIFIGTNDRRCSPSCGSVGFRANRSTVDQRCWHPSDVGLAYFGDHFTIVSAAFVSRYVAPIFLA